MSGQLAAEGRGRLTWTSSRLLPSDWRKADTKFCLASAAILRGDDVAWADLSISKIDHVAACAEGQAEGANVQAEVATIRVARHRSPEVEARFEQLHELLADKLLATDVKLFRTITDFDKEFAQKCQDSGVSVSSAYRGRRQPKNITVTSEQIAAIGEWGRDYFRKLRSAVAGKR